jgi:hypothetical protein
VACDFADEFLEGFVSSSPCFDFADQVQRHIDGAGAALLFEGQMPARSSATGAFELAEVAFQEGAGLGEFAQGELAGLGMTIGGGRFCFNKKKV